MKHLIFAIAVGLAISAICADGQPRKPNPLEALKARRGLKSRPAGGYVIKKYDDAIIAIRDGQSVYKAEEVESVVHEMRLGMGLPVFRLSPEGKHDKIGAEVELVDELSLGKGKSVVAAPEESWARMSVRRLVADSPDQDKRMRRLRVELFRAIMMSMGVGVSFYQPCLMTPVRSLADIDAVRAERWTPYTEGSFDTVKSKFGISRVFVMPYRTACKQGWAPKPVDDEQKKIWDEIMTIPETPITIEKTK